MLESFEYCFQGEHENFGDHLIAHEVKGTSSSLWSLNEYELGFGLFNLISVTNWPIALVVQVPVSVTVFTVGVYTSVEFP